MNKVKNKLIEIYKRKITHTLCFLTFVEDYCLLKVLLTVNPLTLVEILIYLIK